VPLPTPAPSARPSPSPRPSNTPTTSPPGPPPPAGPNLILPDANNPVRHGYPTWSQQQPPHYINHVAQHLFAPDNTQEQANSVTDPVTGQVQEYCHLIKGPDQQSCLGKILCQERGAWPSCSRCCLSQLHCPVLPVVVSSSSVAVMMRKPLWAQTCWITIVVAFW
jgi:hypothetical protein